MQQEFRVVHFSAHDSGLRRCIAVELWPAWTLYNKCQEVRRSLPRRIAGDAEVLWLFCGEAVRWLRVEWDAERSCIMMIIPRILFQNTKRECQSSDAFAGTRKRLALSISTAIMQKSGEWLLSACAVRPFWASVLWRLCLGVLEEAEHFTAQPMQPVHPSPDIAAPSSKLQLQQFHRRRLDLFFAPRLRYLPTHPPAQQTTQSSPPRRRPRWARRSAATRTSRRSWAGPGATTVRPPPTGTPARDSG